MRIGAVGTCACAAAAVRMIETAVDTDRSFMGSLDLVKWFTGRALSAMASVAA
jgi:hypothetical protein